jgi:hypothetical protein
MQNVVLIVCYQKNRFLRESDQWPQDKGWIQYPPKKNLHFPKLVTELCQLIGGGWKLIIAVSRFLNLYTQL